MTERIEITEATNTAEDVKKAPFGIKATKKERDDWREKLDAVKTEHGCSTDAEAMNIIMGHHDSYREDHALMTKGIDTKALDAELNNLRALVIGSDLAYQAQLEEANRRYDEQKAKFQAAKDDYAAKEKTLIAGKQEALNKAILEERERKKAEESLKPFQDQVRMLDTVVEEMKYTTHGLREENDMLKTKIEVLSSLEEENSKMQQKIISLETEKKYMSKTQERQEAREKTLICEKQQAQDAIILVEKERKKAEEALEPCQDQVKILSTVVENMKETTRRLKEENDILQKRIEALAPFAEENKKKQQEIITLETEKKFEKEKTEFYINQLEELKAECKQLRAELDEIRKPPHELL